MLDFPASPTTGQAFGQWLWDGVKWTQGNVTATTWPYTDTGRNLIHNGRFEVAQRGAGPWTIDNTLTTDRWQLSKNVDSISWTQIALTDADRAAIGDEAAIYAMQNAFTGSGAAGAYNQFIQHIENLRRLSGKTVTISLWARRTAGTISKIGINVGQLFGSGGSPSTPTFVTGQPITISASWARYSATFTLPSVSGKTLGSNGDDCTHFELWYSDNGSFATRSGSIGVQSGTIQLWGIQLEIGSVATPLAKRDPADEIQLCSRFYQTGIAGWWGNTAAGQSFGYTLHFPVVMRAVPGVTLSGQGYANASGATAGNPSVGGFNFNATGTAAGTAAATSNWQASADL